MPESFFGQRPVEAPKPEHSGIRPIPTEEQERKILLRSYKHALRDWKIDQELIKSLDREDEKFLAYLDARAQGASEAELGNLRIHLGLTDEYGYLDHAKDRAILNSNKLERDARNQKLKQNAEKLRKLEQKLGFTSEEIATYRGPITGEIENFPVDIDRSKTQRPPSSATAAPSEDTVPYLPLTG